MITYKRIILICLFISLIIIPLIYSRFGIGEVFFFEIKSSINKIQIFIEKYFYISLLLYFILVGFSVILNIPGSSIKAVLSGILFGVYFGSFITILSISVGSFFSIKFYKYFIKFMFNKSSINKIKSKLRIDKEPSTFLLILIRIILIIPLPIQNIYISSFKINSLKVFISTILGVAPILIVYNYIGSTFTNIILSQEKISVNTFIDLKSISIFVILISLILILSYSSTKIVSKVIKG